MNQLIVVIFVFFTVVLRAQVNNSNTQSTSPANPYNNSNSIEIENEKLSRAKKTESLEKPALDEEDAVKESKEAKKAKLAAQGQYKSNFTATKTSASHQSYRRSPTIDQQTQMNEVVTYYEKNDPNSFEYHYFKYVSGNYNVEWYAHLEQAKKLKPNNLDVAVQLVAYHYIMDQPIALNEQLSMLFQSGKIEPEMLVYSKHLLQSVEEGGVLITHGFDDTYSALYVQQIQKQRTDVNIISLDFLQSTYYRKKLENSGLKMPANSAVDVSFLEKLCNSNSWAKMHLSVTLPKPYLQPVVNQLSVVGLTFRYDVSKSSYLQKNEELWELWKTEIFSYTKEPVKKLSSNYLPLLFYLRAEKKQDAGGGYAASKKNETDEFSSAIDKLSVQCKQQEKVKAYK